MSIKFLVVVFFSLVAITAGADETISPDFNKLSPEWSISAGGKIVEELGVKYLKLEVVDDCNISKMSYSNIPLNGIKQVKISLKYRTNVVSSTIHGGAWYMLGFRMKDGTIKYGGLPLPTASEWTAIERTFDVPENTEILISALRLQDGREDNVLDAKNISIELIK